MSNPAGTNERIRGRASRVAVDCPGDLSARAVRLWLSAIIALGIGLRLWSPAMRSDLWFDEVYSYGIAQQSVRQMMQSLLLGGDAHPPLYILLLHFWLKLGDSDANAKLLSLLFGIIAIPVLYLLSKGIADQKTGVLSALVLASSQTAITYSVEARCYSLLMFLSVLSVHLLLSAFREGVRQGGNGPRQTWRLVSYSLVTVLAIYTHWFGLLVAAVQATALATYYPYSRRLLRQYLLCLIAIALFCLPLLPFLWNQLVRREVAGGFLWPGRPDLRSLYDLGSFLFGGRALLALGGVVFIWALCSKTDAPQREGQTTKNSALFFGAYLVLPVLAVYIASNLLTRYSFFVFRYFLPFIMSVPILLGLALSRVRRRIAITTLMVFVLFPITKFLKHSNEAESPYSWTASELSLDLSEDVLVAHLSPMSYYPVLHYRRSPLSKEKILWSKAIGAGFPLRAGLGGGLINANELTEVSSLQRYREMWLVIDQIDQDKRVLDTAAYIRNNEAFLLLSEKHFLGLRLEHYLVTQPDQ